MYQGFELAHNGEIKCTYVGTMEVADFEDAFIDKLNMDIGLVCYKQIVISDGAPVYVSAVYYPDYTEDGEFNGYLELEEDNT